MQLEIGFGTHQGRQRHTNQDSVGVFQPGKKLFSKHSGLPLFVVADGMGGHRGGAVASRMAVQTVGKAFAAQPDSVSPTEALRSAVLQANAAVWRHSEQHKELAGMGTTIVAVTATEESAFLANVGDSRGYYIHNEEMGQVTQDHSLLAEQVRLGTMSEEQAAASPVGRNVITRAVGRREQLEVDLFEQPWEVGDMLLLCSDGLWGPVSEAQILAVLLEFRPQDAVQKLIQMAMTSQAPDNIGTIVVRRTG
jgi:protein phosphatase